MKLRIRPLKKRDAGRSIAAVNEGMLNRMDIEEGEHASLSSGGYQTVVRVFSGYDDDKGKIIRVDGETRNKVNSSVDDKVTIESVDVEDAKSVTFGVPEDLRISGDIASYVKEKVIGTAVVEGQNVNMNLGLGVFGGERKRIPVHIVDTSPSNTVEITEKTEVNIEESNAVDIDDSEDESENESSPDGLMYEDIGGLDEELEKVREMVELPMNHPELFNQLGIEPPKGVLLQGPPGTGKTLLARSVANEVNAEFYSISGPEVMTQYYGKSEKKLREIFNNAEENAPAIIFFDEIDGLAPDRDGDTDEFENRVVTQLLSLMDGLDGRGDVIVMAATNRADAIDNALRRGGRFDREIEIGVPDYDGRKEVLEVHTRGMPIDDGVKLDEYAEKTHGFVGADLATFTKEAAMNALRDYKSEIDLETDTIDASVLNSITVSDKHFKEAINEVEPSAMREFFVEVPDVSWDDVGGLQETKDTIQEMIQWPMEHSGLFEEFNVESSKGVLLYGPPGTGKTLMAKAVANEVDSNFISVKGPELLSKAIGESEESVREVFDKARENSPSIIFFDELDAIAGERDGGSNDGGVTDRVVTQLLTELDGIDGLENVTVIATTNRPDMIDGALTRPGRLEQQIYVPVPDSEAREEIIEVHLDDKPVNDDVNIDEIVGMTEGYVGADLEAVCRESAMTAIRELVKVKNGDLDDVNGQPDGTIHQTHIQSAVENIPPSVSEEDRGRYSEFEDNGNRMNHEASGFDKDPQNTMFM